MKETLSLNIDPITNDAIETGPTPTCLELPSKAYINGGTKLESENHIQFFSIIVISLIKSNYK